MIDELMHLSSQDLMPKMSCGDNTQCSKSEVQIQKNNTKQEQNKHGPLKIRIGRISPDNRTSLDLC